MCPARRIRVSPYRRARRRSACLRTPPAGTIRLSRDRSPSNKLVDLPADPVDTGLVARPAGDQDQAPQDVTHRFFLILEVAGKVFQQSIHRPSVTGCLTKNIPIRAGVSPFGGNSANFCGGEIHGSPRPDESSLARGLLKTLRGRQRRVKLFFLLTFQSPVWPGLHPSGCRSSGRNPWRGRTGP